MLTRIAKLGDSHNNQVTSTSINGVYGRRRGMDEMEYRRKAQQDERIKSGAEAKKAEHGMKGSIR